MTTPRIDLHTHSAKSDGTETPTELLLAGARAGLTVQGITDHDTTAGWAEAEAAVPQAGVALVRGAEISCAQDGVSCHLLALLFTANDPGLSAIFARARRSRAERAQQLTANIAADYPISWDDVQEWAPAAGPIGRPHIADALVAAGCFPDRNACFAEVLHASSPYYVRYWAPDPVTAVQAVVAAGGVPILAHPRARKRQRRHLGADTIGEMVEAGLFALEAHHRDHDLAAVAEVESLANHFGIAVTGASDYHGTGKPNRLGENTTTPEVFAEIAARGRLAVVYP